MNQQNLKRMILRTFTQLLLGIFLFSTSLFGQGWQKGVNSGWRDLLVKSNGHYVTSGTTLVEFDSAGNPIWTYAFDLMDTVGMDLLSIAETSEQELVVSGALLYRENGSPLAVYKNGDLLVAKIDPTGMELWKKVIPIDTTAGRDYGNGIVLGDDGSIYVVGTSDAFGGQEVTSHMFLIKLDAEGNELWFKNFEFGEEVLYSDGHRIVANQDGTVTVLGEIIMQNNRNMVLLKVDPNGNTLWNRQFSLANDDIFFQSGSLSKGPNGGYVLGGTRQFDPALKRDAFLIGTNEEGIEMWTRTFENPGDDKLMDIEIGHDNSIIFTGVLGGSALGGGDILFRKLDQEGNEIWSRIYGGYGNDLGAVVKPTNDGGYILLGYKGGYGFLGDNFSNIIYPHLFKMDSLGLINTSKITGHIFDDFDLDCAYNSEEGKVNWLVEATGNGETYYGIADSNGLYCLPLDTGAYALRLITSSPYWEYCDDTVAINLAPYDTLTIDFAAQAAIDCPYLEVDISTTFLRRCFENSYTVSYCNQGTAPAEEAYVEVSLDTYLDFITSSIPIASQDENLYTFNIGTIAPGDCGAFTIDVIVNCDSTEIGQTHCSEARIYPNELCLETPDWSGASIELDASCNGDSVTFTIKNVGTAPTSVPINYLVIEDQVILFQDNTTLGPGEDKMIAFPANGSTLRLEADQEPNHPGNDLPSIAVEGCGSVDGNFSLGFVTQFPENDGNPFVSIDCQQNIGSWDPNDKQAFPKGFGEAHLIEPNTDLEYLIRFQNTGTDTAFNIVVRDPIDDRLDLTTLKMGSSSHPYRYEIQEDRTLSVYFDYIMLPDSNVNEKASHGFFKFRIKQLRNNPIGSEIKNTAFIYFDFNEAVVTNQVIHQIGIDFLEVTMVENPFVSRPVKIFPNPFAEVTTIEVPGAEGEMVKFRLLDVSGRLIKEAQQTGPEFKFYRNELPRGFYFYQILVNKRLVNSGKLVVQ